MNPNLKLSKDTNKCFIHKSGNAEIVDIDNGASLGVPTELIRKMNTSSLGVLLKLLASSDEDASEFLRVHGEHNSDALAFWMENITAAGFIHRREREGEWDYVISCIPITPAEAAKRFALADATRAVNFQKGGN